VPDVTYATSPRQSLIAIPVLVKLAPDHCSSHAARFATPVRNSHCKTPGFGRLPCCRKEIDWSVSERQTRAVAEFLAALDDEDAEADRKLPKVISPVDPCSAWTAKANIAFSLLWAQLPDRYRERSNCRCGSYSCPHHYVKALPEILSSQTGPLGQE